MSVTQEEFDFYRKLLLEKSGLALTEEKKYLLSSRLTPVSADLGYKTFSDFTSALKTSRDTKAIQAVVEAMTTNETSFFRDTKPFNMLRDLLPGIVQANAQKKTIRIWSAAASTGQECYSIAMTLHEFFKDKPGWKIQIIGTDISRDVLDQAAKGEYNQFEIQRGLTIQMMVKYFTQTGQVWKIKDEIRNMVQFQYANLLENFSNLGLFDIIFCRNVLIYFNNEIKTQVLCKLAERLPPEGHLFLGSCESILSFQVPFKGVQGMHGVYKPLR